MRYLVTGALGAVGAWTVRALLDRGHDVVTYDLGGSDHRLRLALTDEQLAKLARVHGDVTDLAQLERVLDEHDVTAVIHLAALQVPFVRDDPVAGARVNVTGTVNVLEAVRRRGGGMRPVVYASSIAAVPEPGEAHPSTLYGVFKLANEGTAERYFADYGVSSVGLRPHTVYGPGRDQGLTSAPTSAMAAAAAGREYRIPFGGSTDRWPRSRR
jgi:nucleoside-diphosphate-sugar epimerase